MAEGKKKVREFLETVREGTPEPGKASEWPHTVRQAVQYICQYWYEKELTIDKLKVIVYAGIAMDFPVNSHTMLENCQRNI